MKNSCLTFIFLFTCVAQIGQASKTHASLIKGYYVPKKVQIELPENSGSLLAQLSQNLKEKMEKSFLEIRSDEELKLYSLDGLITAKINRKNKTITLGENKYQFIQKSSKEFEIRLHSLNSMIIYKHVPPQNKQLLSLKRSLEQEKAKRDQRRKKVRQVFTNSTNSSERLFPFKVDSNGTESYNKTIYLPSEFCTQLQSSRYNELAIIPTVNDLSHVFKDCTTTNLNELIFARADKPIDIKVLENHLVSKRKEIFYTSPNSLLYQDNTSYKAIYFITTKRFFILNDINIERLTKNFHSISRGFQPAFSPPKTKDLFSPESIKSYSQIFSTDEIKNFNHLMNTSLDKLTTFPKMLASSLPENLRFKPSKKLIDFNIKVSLNKGTKKEVLKKILKDLKPKKKTIYKSSNKLIFQDKKTQKLSAVFFYSLNKNIINTIFLSDSFSKVLSYSDVLSFFHLMEQTQFPSKNFPNFIIKKFKKFQSAYAINLLPETYLVTQKKSNKILKGVLNEKGNFLLDLKYKDISFSEEGIITTNFKKKSGLFSTDFKVALKSLYDQIIPAYYQGSSPTKQSKNKFYFKKKNRMGLYDIKKRKTLLLPEFNELAVFSNSPYIITKKDKAYSFMDEGQKMIHGPFEKVRALHQGEAFILKKSGKYYLADSHGKILTAGYESLWPHTKYKLIYAQSRLLSSKKKFSTYLTYNAKGIVPLHHVPLYSPSGEKGYIVIRKGRKYGLIDRTGKRVLPTQYDQLHQYKNGYLPARKKNKFGLINLQQKVQVPFLYENLGLVDEDAELSAKLNGKWGLINTANKLLLAFEYDKLSSFKKHKISKTETIKYALAQKEKKFCVVNHTGKILVECKFPKADLRSFILIDKDNKRYRVPQDFPQITKKE